jgi:hypothetical protein
MQRRHLLKAAATLPFAARYGSTLGAAAHPNYFSLFCYVWDVLDEGPAAFARLAGTTGLTHVSLASSYHAGKALLPHNSRRHVYFVEDGAVYFQPDSRFFAKTRMKPRVSRLAEGRNPFREIAQACQGRGIRTTAWTVSLHNTYLGSAYPEYTTRNAFGDRYVHALCPSQPGVLDYMRALCANLASYPIDAVDFESFQFIPFRHYAFVEKEGIQLAPFAHLLVSVCFCEACLAAAKRHGVNGAAVAESTREWLTQYFDGKHRDTCKIEAGIASVAGLADYLEMRFSVLENCLREATGPLRESKKKVIYLIGSDQQLDHAGGIDLRRLAKHADAVEYMFYARPPEDAPAVVRNVRNAVGPGVPVYLILRPGYPDAEDAATVARLTRAALAAGAEGVSYYNFGLIERSHMEWVRDAIRSASGFQ